MNRIHNNLSIGINSSVCSPIRWLDDYGHSRFCIRTKKIGLSDNLRWLFFSVESMSLINRSECLASRLPINIIWTPKTNHQYYLNQIEALYCTSQTDNSSAQLFYLLCLLLLFVCFQSYFFVRWPSINLCLDSEHSLSFFGVLFSPLWVTSLQIKSMPIYT